MGHVGDEHASDLGGGDVDPPIVLSDDGDLCVFHSLRRSPGRERKIGAAGAGGCGCGSLPPARVVDRGARGALETTMTPEAAAELLGKLTAGVRGRVWISDGIARADVVAEAAGRRAQVATPGDRWFALDVDDGFSLDRFEDDVPEAEAAEILGDLVRVAIAYVEAGGVVRNPESLSPVLVVRVAGVEYELRRSVVDVVRGAWRRLRGR